MKNTQATTSASLARKVPAAALDLGKARAGGKRRLRRPVHPRVPLGDRKVEMIWLGSLTPEDIRAAGNITWEEIVAMGERFVAEDDRLRAEAEREAAAAGSGPAAVGADRDVEAASKRTRS